MTSAHSLFDRNKSCLAVIDVQRYFLDKLATAQARQVVERIAWLVRLAGALDIPVIATAEDVAHDGPLVDEVACELPESVTVHDKFVFGLAGQQAILDEVVRTGREEIVVVGLETDVCVAHSVIGLLEHGYRIAVINDATASPAPNHDYGIARVRAAGATVTSTKGIYYEWVRDLTTMHKVRAQMGEQLPLGLTL